MFEISVSSPQVSAHLQPFFNNLTMSPIPNLAENGSTLPALSVHSLIPPQAFAASAASAIFSSWPFTKSTDEGATWKTNDWDASFITVSPTPSTTETMPDARSATKTDAARISNSDPGVTEETTPNGHEFDHHLLEYCREHTLTAGCPHVEEAVKAHNDKAPALKRREESEGDGSTETNLPGYGGGPFLEGYTADEQIGIILGIVGAGATCLVLAVGGVAYCKSCYDARKNGKAQDTL